MKDLFIKDSTKAAEDKAPVRAAAEPAISTIQHHEGIAPPQRALLDLQRSHGNRFVVEMLDQSSTQPRARGRADSADGSGHQISGGEPLDSKTREAMESHLGQDFGNVRIHSDAEAGRAAANLQAQAFTFGNDIFFGAGRYRSGADDPLLAHELVHTAQQQPNAGAAAASDAELEAQADKAEGPGPAGTAVRSLATSGPRVQRKANDATQAPPAHSHREAFFERIAGGVAGLGKAVWHGLEAVGGATWKGVKAVGHGIAMGAEAAWTGIKAVGRGIAAGAEAVWTGIQWVSRQLWDKLTSTFERVTQWVGRLPERLQRLLGTLWEGVKSLHPWSLKWWESLAHASTWGDFLKWLGTVAVDLAEVLGIPEIAETLADLIKFNTRALTGSERSKAASVFGASINLDLVRIDEGALSVVAVRKLMHYSGPRPFTTFHTINGEGGLSDDTLIHELTHVWQYERVGAIYLFQAIHAQQTGGYNYGGVPGLQAAKTAGEGILSFNREQQAQIVEDFYLIKTGKPPYFGAGGTADLPLYAYFVKYVSTLSAAQLVV